MRRSLERAVPEGRRTLVDALPSGGWTALHDVAWPGRRRAAIDHVVVGPSGVHVVLTRTWSGAVALEEGALRCDGRDRIGALRQTVAAAAAVASVWPQLPPAPVHGVLCLTGSGGPTASFGCVSVCSPDTLAEMLTARPAVVAEAQVRTVVGDLRWLLRGAAEARPRLAQRRRGSFTPVS